MEGVDAELGAAQAPDMTHPLRILAGATAGIPAVPPGDPWLGKAFRAW